LFPYLGWGFLLPLGFDYDVLDFSLHVEAPTSSPFDILFSWLNEIFKKSIPYLFFA